VGSLLFLAVAVVGTTTIIGAGTTSQVWADVFEGTEGPDFIIGTPEDDIIDSKGGDDGNFGDALEDDGFGDDVIISGDGSDLNNGDTNDGDGFGDDVIISGGDDQSTGNGGRDIFLCGEGEEDTVTDFNEEEGDIATPDCENI
jgi:hypothetical protein